VTTFTYSSTYIFSYIMNVIRSYKDAIVNGTITVTPWFVLPSLHWLRVLKPHISRRCPNLNAEEIIKFCLESESLKRIPRTGWVLAGQSPSECESVASHSWGTAHIALLLALSLKSEGIGVEVDKLLTMAILHDLPESLISDIPHRAVAFGGTAVNLAKSEAERNAMRQMLGRLGTLGESLRKQWNEFEDSKSLEARLVAAADKLDMLVHAISLESVGFPARNLDGFFEHVRVEIDTLRLDVAKSLFERLHERHRDRLGDSCFQD
jgi:5'-deoxynucleotidase YfbR-like HD superfamily hydrolase